jgi:putative endonuclease
MGKRKIFIYIDQGIISMFYVYLLQLSDGSLYTGYTKDLDNRLEQHKSGQGSKYVRSRLPFELVHLEEYVSR